MASACVNNIGDSTNATSSYSSYGWFSPRLSFSRDSDGVKPSSASFPADLPENTPDPAGFEFLLIDHPASVPADELFSGGKLVPLHLSALKPDDASASPEKSIVDVKSRRRSDGSVSGNDPYLFSPKAPRCSSRWRELLGLRKLYNTSNPNSVSKIGESHKTTTSISSSSSSSSSSKSIKNFLHRSSKSYSDSSSLALPLLTSKDSSSSSDSFESLSISSSRLSLSSSSSSGHDHDDLPRHSLDFPEKPPAIALRRILNKTANPMAAVRSGRSPVRRRAAVSAAASRGVSVDSPRMNSSGKIVFQSLERSSSSPSSFCNGGPRYKHHRPMERSYSGGVRVVTPVLNVPVCSLRVGFGQLFAAPQKRSELTIRNSKSTTTRTT